MIHLAAFGLAIETVLFVLAGFHFFRRRGYTLAEVGASAILGIFAAFSLIHQIDIFVGLPWLGHVLASMALLGGIIDGWRRWPVLIGSFRSVGHFIVQERIPCLIIAGAWAVMGGVTVAGLTATDAQISMMAGIGWTHGNPIALSAIQPILPLNATALFYHTSCLGLPPGACGFGLLAHLAIGLSTYALARRYAWSPMAMTITLLVMSMPRLVTLSLRPTAELISVAAVTVCVLLIYRLVEQHQIWDLHFFLLCLGFSVYAHPMSLALVPVLILLLAVLMTRRHGWLMWRELLADRPILTVVVILVAMGLGQVPVISLNAAHHHPLLGTAVVFDTDGIIGATANLIRYLFTSIDPTKAVRDALVWLIRVDLTQVMTGLYNTLVVSLFGRSGASAPFIPVFSGSGPVGFGPFAALMILPAMVHAALRGPRRLKALSVAWAGYLYLAALILAWTTDNLVVLTPLFIANGFMVAFFLPPWRLRRRGMRLLQLFAFLVLAATLIDSVCLPP